MDTISEDSSCDIAEDVRGVRRQRVSLSSVDSEPIPKRRRFRTLPLSYKKHDSDDSYNEVKDSDCSTRVLDTINQDDFYSFCDEDDCSSAAGEGRSMARSVIDNEQLLPAETRAALYDTNGEPLVRVPIERVSGGMVAFVTATIARENTVIADNAEGALVMDAGTRICLADGSVVGVITAVMGPVVSCAYAIVCLPAVFDALQADGKLAAGTHLCYDLGEQHIIYDPAAQCDMRRGTDASYIDDEELPPHARPDFSDDEAERQWKIRRRMDANAEQISSDDEPVDIDWDKISALERCLRDPVGENNAADEITQPAQCRLVVPPWIMVAAAGLSCGEEGEGCKGP